MASTPPGRAARPCTASGDATAAWERPFGQGGQARHGDDRQVPRQGDALGEGRGDAHAGERTGAVPEGHRVDGVARDAGVAETGVEGIEDQGGVFARRHVVAAEAAVGGEQGHGAGGGGGFEREQVHGYQDVREGRIIAEVRGRRCG